MLVLPVLPVLPVAGLRDHIPGWLGVCVVEL